MFMFLYKILKAIMTNNYLRKKIKYIYKYNLNYNLDNYKFLNISLL